MLPEQKHVRDDYQLWGLVAIAASFTAYALSFLGGEAEGNLFAAFIFNYGVSAVYFCSLWFTGRLRSSRGRLDLFFLSLVLFLISAYSLNHSIPVFERSVTWLRVMLVLVGLTCCSLGFFGRMPLWLQCLLSLLMGAGLMLFLYLSIYLLPLYPVSLLAGIALGISLHAFAPVLFVIFILVWAVRTLRRKGLIISFVAGVLLPLLTALVFCLQWGSTDKLVADRYRNSLIEDEAGLPSWIKVAGELPYNMVTERYLKAGLVYSIPDRDGDFGRWGLPNRSFEEVKKHDPLVMTAGMLFPHQRLDEQERIRILASMYRSRHQTEERFWSGDNLATSDVISDVRIWPQYRIGYTEKTLTVANRAERSLWNTQEALYTFYLPEGGVVTSLSLWINGQESKGILTTKGKADSAYRQIVGVEVRDPSVVHWQEGNRVTVRVFPVEAGQHRIVRIGVTAPLAFRNNRLFYENIRFEGPDAGGAQETVRVQWMQPPHHATMEGFDDKRGNAYVAARNYRPDWTLDCDAPEPDASPFCFSGQSYSVKPYIPFMEQTALRSVFLDVNEAWEEEEFLKIVTLLKDRKLYAYDNGLVPVDTDNAHELFRSLHNRRFSLFPLQVIDEPEQSLLVTKSGQSSPDIGDLKGSRFGQKLEAWLNKGNRLCVFNLGQDMNPYLRTLKERRVFRYGQGNVAQLADLCRRSVFVADREDDDHVVVHNAGILLSRAAVTGEGKAPDHLMRLFAYNHLMRALKQGIYTNRETDTTLVNEAKQAYVVTPLSSLVVLETAADYKRFDIKDKDNSLHNATMHGKGAVPEPHEWALIIVALLLMLFLYYRKKGAVLWSRH